MEKRVQLLIENRDCQHCCGDHKSEDCKQKDRVCGGGKNDRGCAQSHKSHELFCAAAKVFCLQSVNSIDSEEEGVLLLIMQVRVTKRILASVFWDIGSTSNFIREAFARACGFRGRESKCHNTWWSRDRSLEGNSSYVQNDCFGWSGVSV